MSMLFAPIMVQNDVPGLPFDGKCIDGDGSNRLAFARSNRSVEGNKDLADIKIPKERRAALNKLRALPEDSLQVLVSALESSSKSIPAIPSLPPDEVEEITNLITELYDVRAYFHMGVPRFASAIAETLQETESLPADELPAFEDRLTKLLTIQSVNVARKAESLKAEYEHIFSAARILTDARPVFGADPSKTPEGTLIIHTLRVSYYDESARLREIYFAMDGSDITALRQILDRAETKSKSLQSLFAAANLRVLNADTK